MSADPWNGKTWGSRALWAVAIVGMAAFYLFGTCGSGCA